jgi:hypothetical protein
MLDYLYKNLGAHSTELDAKLNDINHDSEQRIYHATFLTQNGTKSIHTRKSWFDLMTFLKAVLD